MITRFASVGIRVRPKKLGHILYFFSCYFQISQLLLSLIQFSIISCLKFSSLCLGLFDKINKLNCVNFSTQKQPDHKFRLRVNLFFLIFFKNHMFGSILFEFLVLIHFISFFSSSKFSFIIFQFIFESNLCLSISYIQLFLRLCLVMLLSS